MNQSGRCDNHRKYTAGCTDCRTASRARRRAQYRQKAYGTFQPSWVPVADARAHIRVLIEQHNMSCRQIAREAGINRSAAERIHNGTQAIAAASTIAAILTVKPAPIADTRFVPALATSRRLQALTALGYQSWHIADELGITVKRVREWRRMYRNSITAYTERMIRELYERIGDTPGPSEIARIDAPYMGWHPPAAWDDDALSDPDAQPYGGEDAPEIVDRVAVELALKGKPVTVTELERHHAVHVGRAKGMTKPAIADALGIPLNRVKTLAKRQPPNTYELAA